MKEICRMFTVRHILCYNAFNINKLAENANGDTLQSIANLIYASGTK